MSVLSLSRFLGQFLVIWAFLLPTSDAYRRFLASIPNAEHVPCVGNDRCCYGSSICAAFGHEGCCPTEDENSFGDLFDEDSKAVTWSSKQNVDSDGDGFSNGDELGDPCIQFSGGVAPETWDISHPGEKASKPKERASCWSVVPDAPMSATAVRVSNGDVVVFSLATTRSETCWCWRGVEDALGTVLRQHNAFPHRPPPATKVQSNSPTKAWAPHDAVRLCQAPIWSEWVVVKLYNLRGASQSLNVSLSTASADVARGESIANLLSCSEDQGAFSTTSYTPTSSIPPEPSTTLAIPLILGGMLLILGSCTSALCSKYIPQSRNSCVGMLQAPGCARTLCTRTRFLMLGQLGSASFLGVTATLLFLAIPTATMILSIPIFDASVFPNGHKAPVGRAVGMATLPLLFLTCITGTKTIGGPMLGLVSSDRALVVHRWLGCATTLAALLHAFLLLIAVVNSHLPLDFFLAWSNKLEVNVCAGTIAGVVMVLMGVTAVLRRRFYAAFWAMHLLGFPLTLLFTFLHLAESPSGAGGIVGTSIGILVVDSLLSFLLPLLLTSTKVIRSKIILSDSAIDGKLQRGVVEVVLERRRLFEYGVVKVEAGKYVHLFFPQLSLMSHPFTVARCVHEGNVERFTVLIRSEGRQTFTGRLYNAVKEEETKGATGVPSPLRGYILTTSPPASSHPIPLSSYKKVAFISGGIGITPALGHLHSMLHQPSSKPHPTSFSLLWILREAPLVGPCLAHLEQTENVIAAMRDAPTALAAANSISPALQVTVAIPHSKLRVPIITKRPDLLLHLQQVLESVEKGESVAVVVCGPDSLKAAALDAIHSINSSQLHLLSEEFKF